MPVFSHRDYFQRFRLNVEQYGEILVAQAFRGLKMGDEQPGFDIKVTKEDFNDGLRRAGIKDGQPILCHPEVEIRLEVKSRFSQTLSGRAEVIHCSDNKMDGVQRKRTQHLGMTHLAIILVTPGSRANLDASEEGLIESAWLLTRDMVAGLRSRTTRISKCLSVKEIAEHIKAARGNSAPDIIEITDLISDAATTEFCPTGS